MKRHWPRGLLLGVSMALLLSGGVAVAQDVSSSWDDATMPAIPAGAYFTNMDNEDNALSGNPDDDMGVGPGVNECVYTANGEYPIEFRISSPGGAANLIIAAWDVDVYTDTPGIPEEIGVYFNGGHVGDLTPGPTDTWAVKAFPVTATGNDLVEARFEPDPGSCFGIAWGALEFVDEFVPEPGTIMLLGSGLAGLAGYATLRWRTRE